MEKIVYSEYHDDNLIYNHNCCKNMDIPDTGPQIHDICEIIYLKKGNITYTVEGRTYQVKKDSLIITRPNKGHIIRFDTKDVYDRYDVLFEEGNIFGDIYQKVSPAIDVISFEGDLSMVGVFERMDYYCSYFEGETLKNILHHMVEEVFYNIVVASEKRINDAYTAHPLIVKAVDYIEQNLHRDFRLDALCDELYITESYLHQLFKKYLQMSPKKYIVTKQLALAQREIRNGARPTEIFQSCGFSNYSTFYRAYKNCFGYQPSEDGQPENLREIPF